MPIIDPSTLPSSKQRLRAAWLSIALGCASFAVACATETSDVAEAGVAESVGGANAFASGGRDSATSPTWCDAERVLKAKCQRCHAATPEHGAPFALVTYADTQAVAKSGKARCAAIEVALTDDYMPPSFITLDPPVEPLEDFEKQTLLAWCRAGAVDALDGCVAD